MTFHGKIKKAIILSLILWLFVYFFSPFGVFLANSQEIDSLIKNKEDEIQQLQEEIANLRQDLIVRTEKAKTLKNEINILDNKIRRTELQIRQTSLGLEQTNLRIIAIEQEVSRLEEEVESQKAILAEDIRTVYEYDDVSFLELILKEDKFSDFFDHINSLEVIQDKIHQSFDSIKALKLKLAEEKKEFEEKREEQVELKALQLVQRTSLDMQRREKEKIFNETKGEEVKYQELIKKAQLDIASIRSQIYMLEGTDVSLSLPEAVAKAKYVSSKTGIRPAFLLAVLKKESSWGRNVGSGYWKVDMHPRDRAAFLEITSKLGMNPETTPVSKKPSYGWGGAMGPAQFLPSVWLSYEAEIAELTGHNPPSPWNVDDAFMAAGIKLSRGGAVVQSYNAEWKSAMIYFAGRRWNNPYYSFYGDSVMDLAQVIQEQIDLLER